MTDRRERCVMAVASLLLNPSRLRFFSAFTASACLGTTTGGDSFAVIDTRNGNYIVKDGFETWEQAREFVEAYYLEHGVIIPREANHGS